MKLIRIISQNRRDFRGTYRCEWCNHVEEDEGLDSYDDRNFHDNVIPNMKCKKCGKSTIDLGIKPEFIETKYRDSEVI